MLAGLHTSRRKGLTCPAPGNIDLPNDGSAFAVWGAHGVPLEHHTWPQEAREEEEGVANHHRKVISRCISQLLHHLAHGLAHVGR